MGEVRTTQGNRGSRSHLVGELEEYAFDFGLHDGDPVVAARGGVVTQAHDGKTACGGRSASGQANLVVIDHQDGTYGWYLHFQAGLAVNKGDTVNQGDLLGYAGHTGYTDTGGGCAPHLHFQVQRDGKIFGQSVPICFADVPGNGLPQEGQAYRSGNQPALVLVPQTFPSPMVVTIVPATPRYTPTVRIVRPDTLDLSDAASIIRWTIYAVSAKETPVFEELVGPNGSQFGPYAVGFNPVGYDNGQEIADSMAIALEHANPTCLGYQAGGDRIRILFDGISLRAVSEHVNEDANAVKFLFFRLDRIYELLVIVSVPYLAIAAEQSELTSCNSVQ